jgi:hypothetical protein
MEHREDSTRRSCSWRSTAATTDDSTIEIVSGGHCRQASACADARFRLRRQATSQRLARSDRGDFRRSCSWRSTAATTDENSTIEIVSGGHCRQASACADARFRLTSQRLARFQSRGFSKELMAVNRRHDG